MGETFGFNPLFSTGGTAGTTGAGRSVNVQNTGNNGSVLSFGSTTGGADAISLNNSLTVVPPKDTPATVDVHALVNNVAGMSREEALSHFQSPVVRARFAG